MAEEVDPGPGIVRTPSQSEADAGLVRFEAEDPEARLEKLKARFFDIAYGDPSEETIEYLRDGGNIRLCMVEIMALSEPCEQDQQVSSIRAAYMAQVLQRHGFLKRHARLQLLSETEEMYIDAVVEKMGVIIDAQTPEEALELGHMPSVVERASFRDGEELSEEDFAANHLYLLIDTALKEHTQRRQAVEHHQAQSRLTRVVSNRALNLTVAGGVFAAAITPKVGVLPAHGAHMAETIERGLQVLSGTILGLSAPEALRLKYLQMTHDRRTEDLQEDLAEDPSLADRALRMTYNSTRYGNLDGSGVVTGRSGTDDKEENLRRFAAIEEDIPHLNNDPGGKPYTGEQALGYAARLLVEREDYLRDILDGSRSAATRKSLFLGLVRSILVEDLARMKKGVNASRVRRRVLNAAAVVPAALFPRAASSVHEATALSQGTTGALGAGNGEKKKKQK
jgi:hypothetical protein